MRIKIITTISFILLFCCSCVYAATIGQVFDPNDTAYREWGSGNRYGTAVELSTIQRQGDVLTCESICFDRYSRIVVDILNDEIIELSDGKIEVVVPYRPNIIINVNTQSNNEWVKLYKIMKATLADVNL